MEALLVFGGTIFVSIAMIDLKKSMANLGRCIAGAHPAANRWKGLACSSVLLLAGAFAWFWAAFE